MLLHDARELARQVPVAQADGGDVDRDRDVAGDLSPGGQVSQATVDGQQRQLPHRSLVALGERNEAARVKQTPSWMLPARQRLKADHTPSSGVCQRLVVEDHLAISYRSAKVGSLYRVSWVTVP